MGLHYDLMKSLHKAQARRYLGLAGYVIYIYDFLLTYSEVQRLIWPSQMGVVKICYYFSRVVVPIGLTINTWQMSGLTGPLSDFFCKGWLTAAGYLSIISLAASNMILLIWVHAIYGRPKKLLFGLLAFFFASYVTILVITTIRAVVLIKYLIIRFRLRPVSQIKRAQHFLQLGVEHARTVKSISNSPILSTLYRDGLGYFIVMIILKLVNMLAWHLGKNPLNLFGMEFFWGVTTALVSRILLNLRNAIDHSREGVLDQHEFATRSKYDQA